MDHCCSKLVTRLGLYCQIAILSFQLGGQDIAFSFNVLTEENGLHPSKEFFISQDSRGYVWLGTSGGLQRFDGRKLSNYVVPVEQHLGTNEVTSRIFEDNRGNLWFTTKKSLHCYQWEKDSILSYEYPGELIDYHAFNLEEGDKIWLRIGLGKQGAFWKFDIITQAFSNIYTSLEGKTCSAFPEGDGRIERIIQTEHLTKPGVHIVELANNETRNIDFLFSESGQERAFSGKASGCVVAEDGTIWTGIYNGLGKFSLTAGHGVYTSDRVSGLLEDIGFVYTIVQIDQNRLLVGADQGVFLFDTDQSKFIAQYLMGGESGQEVPFAPVRKMEILHNGTLWLAGENGEIAYSHLYKNRFSPLTEGVKQLVNTIAQGPKGRIWYSTEKNGTYILSSQKRLIRHCKLLSNPSYGGDQPFYLPEIDFFLGSTVNSYWGKTGNNFLFWNNDRLQFEFRQDYFFGVVTSSANKINYCYQRQNGQFLMSLGEKVFHLHFQGNSVDTLPWYHLQHLDLDPIIFFGEDDLNQVYIGDQSGRLIVLHEKGDQVSVVADQENLGTINALHQDTTRNTIHLATSKGLAQLNPQTFALTWLTQKDHNLPQETYYNAIPDEFGNLWLPGNNGLVRYHPDTKAFHRFTTADGLLSNVLTRNASLRVPETGEIWLGGKNGVNVFHPKDIQLSDFKPNISIAELLVNDNPFEPKRDENKGNINEKESLTFNHQDNTLSFRFVALDYSDPEANEYYYQMEGYDEERVYAGTRNFVRYPNLPAGDYNFKVWATNSDKVLNETPKVLSLIIIPPIYQRWWFYLLCLLLVSAIMYAIFQYRLEQALKVERLRVKISSDLHDDVGGMLSGLAMQTELLELTASGDTKPKLARVAEMSRSAMSRMRDTVWAIDARKDTLADLIDRMREHAEETLSPRNIQYSISNGSLELKRSLTTDVRQSLYLIYKEAITNVAKHSNGDTVNIDLSEHNGKLEMSIHDNGNVQQKTYKTTGAGQSNMRMRASSIGAELKIDNSNGFKIQLCYPS